MDYLTLVVVLLCTSVTASETKQCGPTNFVCLNETSYQFCIDKPDGALVIGKPFFCNDGTICDETGSFICRKKTSDNLLIESTKVPTTVESPTTGPTTTEDWCRSVPITSTDSPITKFVVPDPPNCKNKADVGNQPAFDSNGWICGKYYECKKILFFHKLKLKTCPKGQGFLIKSGKCSKLISCQ